MTKEEKAVKAKQGIWKFSWVVVALLVLVLVAGVLSFKTCGKQKPERLREPPARGGSN